MLKVHVKNAGDQYFIQYVHPDEVRRILPQEKGCLVFTRSHRGDTPIELTLKETAEEVLLLLKESSYRTAR